MEKITFLCAKGYKNSSVYTEDDHLPEWERRGLAALHSKIHGGTPTTLEVKSGFFTKTLNIGTSG